MSRFKCINFNTLLLEPNPSKEYDELSEIMSKYGSDKGWGLCENFLVHNLISPNGICHNYTFYYDQLFSKYRNEPLKIFEMGVGVPKCMVSWAGSLLGWKEYFPNSIIFSADFDEDYLYCDDRITSYYVDQESVDSIINLWKNLKRHTFDIIIDDGPHTYISNILFYKQSIHKLKINGFFIIEDINLDFIDILFNEIININNLPENKIFDFTVAKLVIPWPKKFTPPDEHLSKMNNLIIVQKINYKPDMSFMLK